MKFYDDFKKLISQNNFYFSILFSFTIVLFTYTMFAGGTTFGRSPNEQSRIELAVSLAKFRAVSIDPVIPVYGLPFDRSVREEINYSDKAPGLSFLAVPLIWMLDHFLPRDGESLLPRYTELRHVLTWFLIVLPACLFPFLVLVRYEPTHQCKAEISLLFCLVTPLLTYSGVFFGHVPAGVFAALAWTLTIEATNQKFNLTVGKIALAGILSALATTIEYPSAVIGAVIFFSLAMRRIPALHLAVFLMSYVVSLIPCFLYHQLAFGNPFTTGYAFKSDWWHGFLHHSGFFGISVPTFESFLGILIGMKRGVFFYSPILLLIPVGLKQMERHMKGSSLPYVALGIIYVWLVAGFSDWQAGWSAAARHLLPCILVFIFPFAEGVAWIATESQRKNIYALLLICLTVISFAHTFLSVSLSPFFPEHFSSPLSQLVFPAMLEGYFAPTVLSNSDISHRGDWILLLGSISFFAVAVALVKLLRPLRLQLLLPISLLIISIAYAGLFFYDSRPLSEEERHVRSDVLKHIGYSTSNLQNP